MQAIQRANPWITNVDLIYPGQHLVVPAPLPTDGPALLIRPGTTPETTLGQRLAQTRGRTPIPTELAAELDRVRQLNGGQLNWWPGFEVTIAPGPSAPPPAHPSPSQSPTSAPAPPSSTPPTGAPVGAPRPRGPPGSLELWTHWLLIGAGAVGLLVAARWWTALRDRARAMATYSTPVIPTGAGPKLVSAAGRARAANAAWRNGVSRTHRWMFGAATSAGTGMALLGVYTLSELSAAVPEFGPGVLFATAFGGYLAGTAIVLPLWSKLSRRALAVGSLLTNTIGYLMLASATTGWVYITAAVLLGVAASALTGLLVLLGEWVTRTTEIRRARGDPAVRASSTSAVVLVALTVVLSSVLGLQGWLLHAASLGAAAVVSAVLTAATAGLLAMTVPTEQSDRVVPAWRTVFTDGYAALRKPFVRRVGLVYALTAATIGAFDGLWRTALSDADRWLIPLLNYGLVTGALIVLGISLFGAGVLERRPGAFMLGMAALLTVGALAVPVASTLGAPAAGIIVAAVLLEAGSTGMILGVIAVIGHRLPPAEQGPANTATSLMKIVGQLAGAQLAALVWAGATPISAVGVDVAPNTETWFRLVPLGWTGVGLQIAAAGVATFVAAGYLWHRHALPTPPDRTLTASAGQRRQWRMRPAARGSDGRRVKKTCCLRYRTTRSDGTRDDFCDTCPLPDTARNRIRPVHSPLHARAPPYPSTTSPRETAMDEKITFQQVRRDISHLINRLRAFSARHEVAVGVGLVIGWFALLWIGLSVLAGPTGQPQPASPPASTSQAASTNQAAIPSPSSAPSGSPKPKPGPVPGTDPGDPVRPAEHIHTVLPGDTLAAIAQRHRVPIEQIAADNRLADPNTLAVGQRLTITAAAPGTEVITRGATLTGYAARHHTTVAALLALNPQITDPDRIVAGAGLRIR